MNTKKASFTLFVILGIILLVLIILFVRFLQTNEDSQDRDIQTQRAVFESIDNIEYAIVSKTKDCMEEVLNEVAEETVFSSFFAGDLYNPSSNNYYYFFYNGTSYLPSRQFISEKLNNYMIPKILLCIDDFHNIREVIDGQIIYDSANTTLNTSFFQETTNIIFDSKIQIIFNDNRRFLQPITISKETKANIFYNSAEKTIFPQEYDTNTRLFFFPAITYLEDKDLGYFIYTTPPCRQLNFLYYEKEQNVADEKKQVILSFKIQGVCNL